MRTELQQYAAAFEAELVAFRDLPLSEFLSKVIGEEWAEDLDTQYDLITEYFDPVDIQHYHNKDYSYFEIHLVFGWPNVYLNVSTRWESVEYVLTRWGESYRQDLSYLYDTVEEVYSLSAYQ